MIGFGKYSMRIDDHTPDDITSGNSSCQHCLDQIGFYFQL